MGNEGQRNTNGKPEYTTPHFHDFRAEAEEINQQMGGCGWFKLDCDDPGRRMATVEMECTELEVAVNCVNGALPLRQQLAAEFRRVADFYLWMAEHVYPSQAKPEREGAAK